MWTIDAYVEAVLRDVEADAPTRARLRDDLTLHLMEAAQEDSAEAVLSRMGPPEETARELMEALFEDRSALVRALVRTRAEARACAYTYVSRVRLLGLPLVHINCSRGGGFHRPRIARGILAIGDVAIGAVALGGIALGGFAIGGFALGILALAGIALGGIVLGGVGIGMLAFGGVAVGLYAFGGAALAGRVAAGGFARAAVAIGGNAEGLYAFSIPDGASLMPIQADQARAAILNLYPGTPEWLIRMMTVFIS